MTITVLVVEDDRDLREALVDTLELAEIRTIEAEDGETAILRLKDSVVDMVVSDVNMPGIDGHALLEYVREQFPALPFLLITAFAQVGKAVEAIRKGAVDYLVKPFEADALVDTIRQFASGAVLSGNEPVAEDGVSKQLLQLARRVAVTDSTVLITGESGTGKEVLARYIHDQSTRAGEPFIAINCAAIPENMLEAMLFGHEKGAFTGAVNSQPGKFEQANGGTLLLDEVTEMDIGLQAKLLRVLQEQEVERVGGRSVIKLDVRVLATTNRELSSYVADGQFREDLYYRLNVFPLQWLPLRERKADIVPLAKRLLEKYCQKMKRPQATFMPDAEAALINHQWPGNVRELDNVIQRALILQTGNQIMACDLHMMTGAIVINASTQEQTINQSSVTQVAEEVAIDNPQPAAAVDSALANGTLGNDLRQHEYQLIIDALRATGGSRKEAAEKLEISPRTLRYKLAKIREAGIDLEALLKP
ncbi:sigma-54 dependent transcriptional regulator [Neptunomonas phycophila]|uniref:Sigma-54 dependent transcriptional regulator n=1 Tax=Neptunomonas phycophila TaxID=1572645 RepID=A0AAW7XPK0_9GAMM|nr:sigma-54 dependent transcriptional regulator [Neptunomonas phycophila]MBT3144375.1 sigma-54 dependent transcriptional regulator [Neptunomonas phycophila]MDO6455253.1 sigma-54 dependent transcriptional regulator [Neptunomonas phycophila]MDO6469754.1 sigma-54 dependent transcriptional regulator [Neptunomonas phycophila]MDO6785631.1 sigma-54 dependent transcriptional regulator [Neptunomonas phycophila]MDP2524104.1 sigma-54 dependent transcriptional regulator [Neptunomonas phycophila]